MNNVNQGEQCTFNNPIMPGFYPDPSVCRVGEDFYLVKAAEGASRELTLREGDEIIVTANSLYDGKVVG